MMEKPAPVIEAEFTVKADAPVDVSVTVFVTPESTATLPKLRVVGLIDNCGFPVVPAPLRVTTAVPPLAELVLMVSCPLADPSAVGLN